MGSLVTASLVFRSKHGFEHLHFRNRHGALYMYVIVPGSRPTDCLVYRPTLHTYIVGRSR